MSQFRFPANPNEGPAGLPTPGITEDVPANPGEGPVEAPTPELPSRPSGRCPAGYRRAVVQSGQSYTDLLIENNVSYNALKNANPDLSTGYPRPGTQYCAPPTGTRAVCSNRSYVMSQGETLYTLVRTLGISAGRLLAANPNLAPGDFLPGRVICLP